MKEKKIVYLKQLLKKSFKVVYFIFRIFPIKENKVVVSNYVGKGYGDNAKYIVEELLNRNKNIDIVWLINDVSSSDNFPPQIRLVKINSIRSIYEQVTAKIWIDNVRKQSFVLKRKKQYYIQTWHGGIPLKKIEYDAFNSIGLRYINNMINDNRMIDLMVSNSKYTSNLYRTAFKYNGEILETGIPRNDCFISKMNELKLSAYSKLKFIDKQTKILLYVPTFRIDYSNNPYDIDFDKVLKLLEKKYNCKWKIMIKLHPNVPLEYKLSNCNNKNICNVSNYNDTQELESISDIIITDYSSLMFEALEINKPVVLYCKDYIEYIKNDREFYYDLSELPFKVAYDNNDLINILNNVDLNKLNESYNDFKNKIGLIETGNSSRDVVDIILSKIN